MIVTAYNNKWGYPFCVFACLVHVHVVQDLNPMHVCTVSTFLHVTASHKSYCPSMSLLLKVTVCWFYDMLVKMIGMLLIHWFVGVFSHIMWRACDPHVISTSRWLDKPRHYRRCSSTSCKFLPGHDVFNKGGDVRRNDQRPQLLFRSQTSHHREGQCGKENHVITTVCFYTSVCKFVGIEITISCLCVWKVVIFKNIFVKWDPAFWSIVFVSSLALGTSENCGHREAEKWIGRCCHWTFCWSTQGGEAQTKTSPCHGLLVPFQGPSACDVLGCWWR